MADARGRKFCERSPLPGQISASATAPQLNFLNSNRNNHGISNSNQVLIWLTVDTPWSRCTNVCHPNRVPTWPVNFIHWVSTDLSSHPTLPIANTKHYKSTSAHTIFNFIWHAWLFSSPITENGSLKKMYFLILTCLQHWWGWYTLVFSTSSMVAIGTCRYVLQKFSASDQSRLFVPGELSHFSMSKTLLLESKVGLEPFL